jgi:hypothetical protein
VATRIEPAQTCQSVVGSLPMPAPSVTSVQGEIRVNVSARSAVRFVTTKCKFQITIDSSSEPSSACAAAYSSSVVQEHRHPSSRCLASSWIPSETKIQPRVCAAGAGSRRRGSRSAPQRSKERARAQYAWIPARTQGVAGFCNLGGTHLANDQMPCRRLSTVEGFGCVLPILICWNAAETWKLVHVLECQR